jgi:hypothetical protein
MRALLTIDNCVLETNCQDTYYCNYEFGTEGDSLGACLENAWVFEIDQDGGEIKDYPLAEAPAAVIKEAEHVIRLEWAFLVRDLKNKKEKADELRRLDRKPLTFKILCP